ncbi:MAG: recombination protein RecR [Candidatus Wildermuthbacteria bacterium RIFCSPHIGHO2_01_FULL_48_25]|uniref:Recombination protein RecR n=1 Tax=Candidatus Wildermuthbacteria bacterium RIFCSPLOWO2_01_FULL_48_16 TaxID=1802461 RepID=A0A1G2RP35_9BACT|nr:MAG: recombination protein RecR [Candidatus Wildermuthbacteria bacterium RIFCSPHIGHO2_01_FULL_48_25]OHA68114.1 MAG: recombination protein RecR [Candidatus Wildermuthbacteria bacterium RIFCSPHIGHO2_02_FULL_49_12b]OHA73791.1 MAG: recombination protein RecR [Candidatus Wildermuthbacteria bacterium RIFCSPLOWO2_01_FULL_48_16]
MYPSSIQKLIELFSRFPTIGPRTASRLVFYLLKLPSSEVDEFVQAVRQLRQSIQLCKWCFNPFDLKDDGEGLCGICKDNSRDNTLLCVVEKESDLAALEKTKSYNGLYFILGGNVGQLRKEELQGIRVEELKQRIQNQKPKEVILATNLTTEGETTALYLERVLQPLGVETKHLGRGLPIGSELEYADEETLRQAFASRR